MVKHQVVSDMPSESSDCKYKGVRKRKWGKWVSEIRLPNSRERIWLGSYDSAKKAARAFDAAMYCLRGHTAKFNFPNDPPEIAGGRSLTPAEIQVAAARFANSETTPVRAQSENTSSTTEDNSEQQVESPCASVISDGTGQLDGSNELMWDGPVLDLLAGTNLGTTTTSSDNYGAEYGIFPGFDDLHSEFFTPSTGTHNVDYVEENFDSGLAQTSFLWNF